MSCDNTVHQLEATTFKDYQFLENTYVAPLIKQIPDESPYIDVIVFDVEPLS